MTFADLIVVGVKQLVKGGVALPMTLMVLPNDKTAAVLRIREDGSIKTIIASPALATEPGTKIQLVAMGANEVAGAKTFDLTPAVQESLAVALHWLLAKDNGLPVA